MSKFKNIGEWISLRKYVPHINEQLEVEIDEAPSSPGFVYPDGSWIQLIVNKAIWHTLVANLEQQNYNINEIEEWLWDHHSSANAEDEEQLLVNELKTYCEDYHLHYSDAGELVCSLMHKRALLWDESRQLTDHIDWLMEFSKRWYSAVNKEGK